MTLFETERLIRKITDLIESGSNPGIAPKLAEDFAAVCHAANLRLQQCEGMLRGNDRLQAIQMAEMSPNLLALVTVLEFNTADDWRNFCAEKSLPVAEKIDGRSVQALNACYAQGIAMDHPLYASYRSAVLERNDEAALNALKGITRLNPSDTNAASELARLDAKILSAQLVYLANAVQNSSPDIVRAQVEKIESAGFKTRPEGDVWQQAQVIRCGCLIDEVELFQRTSLWMDALSMLDFIRWLEQEYKLEFKEDQRRRIDALEQWARGEQQADQRAREFQSLLKELNWRIQQSEEKDTSARYVPLTELKQDSEGLHRVWRSLTDFAWPIPEEVAARFRKRAALLDAEIGRRTRHKRRIVVSCAGAALVVGAVIAWVAIGIMKGRDYSRQLEAAISNQNYRATQKIMEQLAGDKIVFRSGSLGVALGDAESFVNKERALLDAFGASTNALGRAFDGQSGVNNASVESSAPQLIQLAQRLAEVDDSLDKLSPDLKAEQTPVVSEFKSRWQQHKTQVSATVNQAFNEMLAQAEPKNADWIYAVPVVQARTNLAAFTEKIRGLDVFQTAFANALSLNAPMLQRAGALHLTLTNYQGELDKFDSNLAALQQASSFEQYSAAMSGLAGSKFIASPEVKAAAIIKSLDMSGDTVLRALLGVNASQWTSLKHPAYPRFVPVAALPNEVASLSGLWSSPAISGDFSRVKFRLAGDDATTYEWIVAGDLGAEKLWTDIMVCEQQPSAQTAVFTPSQYLRQDGKMTLLLQGKPVLTSTFEVVAHPAETAAFRAVGLEPFRDADAKKYEHPLLDVVDAVKQSHDGSPLFRAYLYGQLLEVIKMNPDGWGYTFSPELQKDAARFQTEIGAQLNSGDWFVASKVDALGAKLETFLKSIQAVSYAKQAGGLFDLEHEMVDGGFRFAGFVGADGKAVLADSASQNDLWGYDASKHIVRLGSGSAWRETPLPLTALYTLTDSREQLLAKASVNPGDPEFKNVLPPLLSPAATPKASP